jgi:hypothetical protein
MDKMPVLFTHCKIIVKSGQNQPDGLHGGTMASGPVCGGDGVARDRFRQFEGSFTLIGGAACDE